MCAVFLLIIFTFSFFFRQDRRLWIFQQNDCITKEAATFTILQFLYIDEQICIVYACRCRYCFGYEIFLAIWQRTLNTLIISMQAYMKLLSFFFCFPPLSFFLSFSLFLFPSKFLLMNFRGWPLKQYRLKLNFKEGSCICTFGYEHIFVIWQQQWYTSCVYGIKSESPEQNTNILPVLFFWWMKNIIFNDTNTNNHWTAWMKCVFRVAFSNQ